MGASGTGTALVAAATVLLLAGCSTPRRPEPPPGARPGWPWSTTGHPGSRDPGRPAGTGRLLLAGPTFDGRVTVNGNRGGHNREALRGAGLFADVRWPDWMVEFAGTSVGTSSSLGIPDQEPSNFLILGNTDNDLGSVQLAGGRRLLETRSPGEEGLEGAAPGLSAWIPDPGTRVDVVGGLWLESHSVTQVLFPGFEVDTASEQWLLPFVGLRAIHDLSSRFRLEERLDAGGFNPGRAHVLRAQAFLSVRITDYAWICLGWSVQRLDLARGGDDGQRILATLSGPYFGIEVRF